MFTKKNIILLCVFLSILFFSSIIILASVPPVSRDSLIHHLAIPKLYVENGAIYEIPDKVVSYYPMNLNMLYMIPLYFGNDIVPKYIHFIFAILTAIFIYLYLKEHIGELWGWVGALFFISIPIIVKLSITVYVDLGVTFFSTASIYYLLKWKNNDFNIKYLVISAVFCGLLLGTKYNGLICLLLLPLLIIFIYARSSNGNIINQLNGLKYGVLFGCIALFVFSPWMIKNYVWTGNPFYPLFGSFFNVVEKGLSTIIPNNMSHFTARKLVFNESLLETLFIPVRIFFQGIDDNPKFFDGKLNLFLLILPCFIFLKDKISNDIETFSDKKVLFIFSFLFMIIVFLQTDMRIRYICPIIPPIVILSVYGLKNIYSFFNNKTFSIFILSFICLTIFTINLTYLYNQFKYVNPFSYLSGQVSKIEYIKHYRPEYSVFQFANQTLRKNDLILALFLGGRSYYSDKKIIFGNGFFYGIVKKANKSIDIIEGLKANNFTHLLVCYKRYNNWANKQYSEKKKETLIEFFKSCELKCAKDGYALYELI